MFPDLPVRICAHRVSIVTPLLLIALTALASIAGGGCAHAQRVEHHSLLLEHGIAKIINDERFGAVVTDGQGNHYRIEGWPLAIWPLDRYRPAKPVQRSEMLPDGVVSRGTRNVRAAWLINATKRYGHGVLGDAIEAGGLAVEDPVGAVARYQLPGDTVFEDRLARIVDVDGDGNDEILTVKTYLRSGAAVAVFDFEHGKLKPLAESESIGLAHRWLNPVGAADFDGDGKVEIAVVRTPHIGGILMFYRLESGKLREVARYRGFSNHRMGSRMLGLSAIADFNHDGVADIAVPTADRRTLRLVGFAGGQLSEIGRIEHERGEIATDIVARDLTGNGRPDLIYGLSSGYLTVVFNR